MSLPLHRLRFLKFCIGHVGAPYIWGAKGESTPPAFDCSGLVTCGYLEAGRPDWRHTHNAQRLADELPYALTPKPGDLALYGATWDAVTHVMVWMDGRVVGACGGGSATVEPTTGAQVQWRSKPEYRRDLLGFRLSPLD